MENYTIFDNLNESDNAHRNLNNNYPPSLHFKTLDFAGLFVGVNITEDMIDYLKRYQEEDLVCINTGI